LRPFLGSLLAALGVFAAGTSCSAPGPAPVKLAAVAPLAKPSLPPWILSISPTGNAESLAQIRVIFAKPVTKVEALSGDGPRDVLSHALVEPALKGHFTVLTPRMIGFVAEQALPIGTRVRITLTAGLRDLDGDSLEKDLAWTFETAPLKLRNLPQLKAADDEATPAPVGLRPTIALTANAPLDPASLAAHASFSSGGDMVGVTARLEVQPTPVPGSNAAELFDPSLDTWVYDVSPQRDLQRAQNYGLKIEPGVEPVYGNVATLETFSGAIRTYGPLAVVPTPQPSPGSGGRFANGDPAIAFTNPLDPKSVVGAVTISPAPANVKTLTTLSDDASVLAIDPYALDPNSTYNVTIASGVKDVFGQTLGQAQNVTVRTGDFAPGAWAPSGSSVIPAGIGVGLNFYATNLANDRYQAAYARVAPQKLFGYADPLTLLPAPSAWAARTLPGARRNVQSVVRVPVQGALGGTFGALAYGFRTALDSPQSPPGNVGIAQLTNLGIFGQFFPARGTVLVQHLSDGAPAGGVRVTVYRNVDGSVAGAKPAPCAAGTTRSDGEVDFQGVDLERCYAGSTANQAPEVGILATEGGDAATLTIVGSSGVYRFAVIAGWSNGAPLSRGTVFSDRQMYQPGERGMITGIAYYVSGSRIVADRNAAYRVTLTDPSNNAKPLGNVKTDAYGIFSMPIVFSKQQALGYYTVDAKGASGNDINGSLRVAEFKPPNFKLSLDVSSQSATAGGTVRASAAAAYLFGAPLQGGAAHAYVTREAATVAPKGWDDFWFGRQWFWPETTPSFDTDVLQRDLPLDAQGKASLDVSVPADLPFPMTYTVDVEATDVSHLSVSDSKSFVALPVDAVIGLASDVVGAAGKPMPIRAIVTDADGHAIAGRAMHVELQKMIYTSATEQVEGGESAQQAVKYETVASADVTSGDKAVTVNLLPPDLGSYRVRANFAGAKSDASATDIQVFAFGAGEADWGGSDPSVVTVELDKKVYAVGDTATALVASPFARSDVYVAIVRGNVLYRTTLHDVGGAARVAFKITPDMLPNAALEAVVVRRGAKLASLKPGTLDTLSRVGMAPFNVDIAGRNLTLGIAPQAATVEPGGSQRVNFTLRRKNGTAASGEIVAMVVNDAILQLSGYRLPDLVVIVFADQPISAILGDNREGIVLKTQTPPLEKGFGYGGGYLAGAASTRVRRHFLPLAYYGIVKTDAAGKASVALTMPDDLTTWRVMAVAVGSDDAHFATSDATFISTQPLIGNPLLPQFARTGDTFDLGVSVSNQTSANGALDLVMKLTGALAFASGDPHAQTATPSVAGGMQAFRFPVVAGTPAPTTFAAASTLGSNRDAFSVPFAVSDRATTDSVIESGAVRDATATVPIDFNRGGWLQLTLANSIVPQFAVSSNAMMGQDALPLADEAAARLTVASAMGVLRGPYALKVGFDPKVEAAANLARMMPLQRGDGGFGEWAGASQSDPFVSAYALEALLFARARGVAVDSAAITRATAFAARTLANPGRFQWCANDPICKAQLRFESLWALAQGGDRRTDFLSDVVAQSDNFDSATKIRLARYLLQTPGWQSQGAAMADRLEQTLYVTGRYAVANVTTRWGWLGSLVDAQAQMLQLLMERHAPVEQLDGAVRALVAQGCKCGWPTIDDAASALTALTAYARNERLGPVAATVTVGNATVATARFGPTASSQSFTLAASSLHGNAIVVRAVGGTAHYTLLYTYNVPNDAPGQLAAFRVVRRVASPGATEPPLATMDLAAGVPFEVAAGHVFDVGVRVIVDHPVDRLVIEDPLPAGLEAVDTTFRTTLKAVVPQSDSWEIDSQQIYSDRVVAYAAHLGPGIYDVHYLVRSVTPGAFAWPGARAYLRDAPEQFGRSAAATLRVTP
jgi:alpha-2-macroglobulin